MSGTTEPAPLTEREMAQFITLAALPTLERALDRLRWLEAQNADFKERIDAAWADNTANDRITDQLRAELAVAKTDLILTQSRVELFRAEVAALQTQPDQLAEMWAALAEYQPQADKDGHGESWRVMCEQRTVEAASAASFAASDSAASAASWAASASARAASARAAAAQSIAAIRRAKEGKR